MTRRRTPARWVLRTAVLAAGVFIVSPHAALAADALTLQAAPTPVAYGGRVIFTGTIAPAVAAETVGIYAQGDDGSSALVASATTDAAGGFSASATVNGPALFVARGADAAGNPVDSVPVAVSVRPRVVASLRGSRRIGARLILVGRVVPRAAGTLTVNEGGRVRGVSAGPAGRFRVQLTTTRLYRYRATLRLQPAAGYVGWRKAYAVRVELRPLEIGSSGPAVAWLEQRLRSDRYALPGADSVYDTATAEAVLAFQKVHGLPRTGTVDLRLWNVLRSSAPPPARVRSGDHIEVDKTRQVLFEVLRGKVVSVAHVSTGATGNTPVGLWHVYAKGPGTNAKGMYDSLFFLRGFAIHGYYSVPPYPASHGCVRTPFWFARGLFSRWGVGASVYVFG